MKQRASGDSWRDTDASIMFAMPLDENQGQLDRGAGDSLAACCWITRKDVDAAAAAGV